MKPLRELHKFYFIDLACLGFLLLASDALGWWLRGPDFMVSFSFLVAVAFLYRWHWRGAPILVLWTLARLAWLGDNDLSLAQDLLVSASLSLPLLACVPFLRLNLGWRWSMWHLVVAMLIGYASVVVVSSLTLLALGLSLSSAVAVIMFTYNFPVVISLVVGLVLFVRRSLFAYVPDLFARKVNYGN